MRGRLRTGPGDERARVLVITSAAHFVNDGAAISYSALYPIFTSLKGLSYLEVSAVSAVLLSTSAISSFVVGRLSRAFDRGLLLSLGMGLWSAALALLVLPLTLDLSPLALLSASALVGGIASSFYHPLGASIIASAFASRLGLALGINGASGALGRSLYALAVPSAAAFSTLALYFLPAAAAACSAAAAAALKGLAGPEARVEESRPPEKGPRVWAGESSLAAVVALLTAFAFARSILGQGFITFLPSFLSKELGLAYGPEVGLATMVATIGAIISQPLLGILSDVLGRLRTLILTTVMSSLSVVGFVIIASRGEVMLSMIPLAGFGIFAFEAFTVTLGYVSELVGPRGMTVANSIVWGIGISAGGAAGPAIAGVLASWGGGLGGAFVALSIINLSSLAPLLLVRFHSRGRGFLAPALGRGPACPRTGTGPKS